MPYTDQVKDKMAALGVVTLPQGSEKSGSVGIYTKTEQVSESIRYLVSLLKGK
jgi:hypothetical protein